MTRTSLLAGIVASLLLACGDGGADGAGEDGDGDGDGGGGGGPGALSISLSGPSTGGDRDVDVAVLWETRAEDGVFVLGQVLTVRGPAPQHFTIDLSSPPPEVTLLDEVWNPDEPDQYGPATPRIAQGYIAALAPGTLDDPATLPELSDFMHESIMGWANGYILTYLEQDVPADSYMEQYVCGTVPKGFHLMVGEIAPSGPFADCPDYPGGSEGNGAMMATATDDLDTAFTIELCADEFLDCADD